MPSRVIGNFPFQADCTTSRHRLPVDSSALRDPRRSTCRSTSSSSTNPAATPTISNMSLPYSNNRNPSFSHGNRTAVLLLLASLVFLEIVGHHAAEAKRFDCKMFCRTSGFTGMVGGCRCSFTLFTAKRSIREEPEMMSSGHAAGISLKNKEMNLSDLMRIGRQRRGVYPLLRPAYQAAEIEYQAQFPELKSLDYSSEPQQSFPEVDSAPSDFASPNSALKPSQPGLQTPSEEGLFVEGSDADTAASAAAAHDPLVGRYISPKFLFKRKEFEQDLDNGDTTDFLRLSY